MENRLPTNRSLSLIYIRVDLQAHLTRGYGSATGLLVPATRYVHATICPSCIDLYGVPGVVLTCETATQFTVHNNKKVLFAYTGVVVAQTRPDINRSWAFPVQLLDSWVDSGCLLLFA